MWKYCGRIFQLGFFILYIIFYSFISFSSTHVSPISLLLFLFLLQNLPATSFALLIKEKRERETKREEKDWGIGVHHAVGDWGSPCTTTSDVPPRLVLLPTIRLGQINLFFSFFFFFSFFIFACSYSTLFYKNWNLFCVLCLDYVRNEVRSACSFSFFFLFSYLLVLIQLYFKNWILFCVLCLD